jgi:signal transduction histidine kinase
MSPARTYLAESGGVPSYRLVAEHLKDIAFRYRLVPSPGIEYISPAAVTLTGQPPARLYENAALLFSVVHPEDRAALEQSWQSPPERPLVVRLRRPDASPAWLEQRAVGIHDQDGRLVAVEGILRDITEQMTAAEERQELEQQLRQAERLDSLGQLAGGIAHDFNNLLGVILGNAGLVIDELGQDDPIRHDVEGIVQAAEQAARLTRQLLIFSQLQPAQPETIDLNAVVSDTEHLLRRTIGEDIEFVVETEPGLGFVTIDRGRLEQIILNLVVNSRTAMPAGGRLTVTTATAAKSDQPGVDGELSSGRFALLTVTDTGCGMEPRVAERAFEPFFSTRSTGRGSGLGLATVYGAVKEASGTIRLSTQPGIGTRISIFLPVAGRPERPEPAASADAPAGQSEHVLVVEDDDRIREVARRMLDRAGFLVTTAAQRDDALRLVYGADNAFDLLLSDVIMPGMSASDFIDLVRTARPNLPIVLMSGYAEGVNRDGWRLPTDIPLVPKPFDSLTLLRAIRTSLDRSAAP